MTTLNLDCSGGVVEMHSDPAKAFLFTHERKMNEPRIHFAINCASYSCPKLLDEAYTAGKINEQLDLVTNEFINSDKNEISENAPKLSKIFSFYTKDFEPNLAEYINKYSDTKINPNAEITFKEYNWDLNEQ